MTFQRRYFGSIPNWLCYASVGAAATCLILLTFHQGDPLQHDLPRFRRHVSSRATLIDPQCLSQARNYISRFKRSFNCSNELLRAEVFTSVQKPNPTNSLDSKDIDDVGVDVVDGSSELESLLAIYKYLSTALRQPRTSQILESVNKAQEKLTFLLNKFNPKFKSKTGANYDGSIGSHSPTTSRHTRKLDICPEKYMSSTYGYPYFYYGFVVENCTNVKRFSSVLSILLDLTHQSAAEDPVKNIFRKIAQHHPGLSVIYATRSSSPQSHLAVPTEIKSKLKLQNIVVNDATPSGSVWNQLLSASKTPYALIGRDMTHFSWDSRLHRHIREISSLNISIAGGAIRVPNGHWSNGCYQTLLKNYSLTYRAGYDSSVHDCLFCDYIDGPFVLRTRGLSLKFDSKLDNPAVFHDFFLRHSIIHGRQSLSCPDTMFHVKDTHALLKKKEPWIDFAIDWKLISIYHTNSVLMEFTCDEVKMSCNGEGAGTGLTPCCMQELADFVKFYMKTCEVNGIICELQEGTLMGAVKFNGILPWELDADLTFLTANYSTFQKTSASYSQAGYSLTDMGETWCCVDKRTAGGKFSAHSSNWHLEINGQHLMDSEKMLQQGMKPTKVMFDGMWVATPTNPGLYVRNRYAFEIYRHAEHWMNLGHETGWTNYRPAKFLPCSASPKHQHSCLNKFSVDGNIQFKQPWP